MVEAHLGADHEAELVGLDLTESLEASDLGGFTEFGHGSQFVLSAHGRVA